ncbi:MAG: DNA gyrase subunit A [Candidatus Firestonebacteria bacterium]
MQTKELQPIKEKIVPVYIEEEVKSSYIDYAMSVIVGRALPDVRDGLKPVQRRILYAMNDMGLHHNKPHRKSAKVIGEVLGNYHPHGDVAVYESMVRMTQDFVYRYPFLDGQGNFGSIDGDPPAAMRYTEIRLSAMAEEILADIDKNTVDFIPNYDQSKEEPVVLPTKLPNLLINGCSGIAVGMATNIPPHNLSEVIDGLIMLIENPDISLEKLMTAIKAPDFPTGGYILGKDGIKDAYRTGRGSLTLQARTKVEDIKGGKERIIVYEIPYQVNKSQLVEHIANLVRDKKMEGISDIRDESNKEGIRIVIDIKRDENVQIVLNQLFKHTSLRTTFGVIMLALVDREPQVLNLKGVLAQYVDYRRNVIVRRTKFEFDKAERRLHIIEGLKIALKELNKIVKLIRNSKDTESARNGLIKSFKFSSIQAQAILDMRLQQLTNLERNKIEEEYKELTKLISKLKDILADPKKVLSIIKEELLEVKKKYGDARRTEVIEKAEEIKIEDLIKEEDVVVALSHTGYVKRLPVSSYKAQKRGGKGITGMETKEEDFVEDLFITTTKDYLLFFTNKGNVFWLKVYEIPEAGRYGKGKPIINLINIEKEETISAAISVKEFKDDMYLIMTTKQGVIKKTKLSEYSNPRSNGIIAIKIREKDELIGVKITNGKKDMILATRNGRAIRFKEDVIREVGRSGIGVRGIRLGKEDYVVGMEVVEEKAGLLTVTENGYGKRTDLDAYKVQSRGGKGLINIKASDRNGLVVGIKEVKEDDEVMVITSSGLVIRSKVSGVRMTGRSTLGVRLIKLDKEDKVTALARLAFKEEE